MIRTDEPSCISRQSLAQLFEQQVRRTPGAVALIGGESVVTYDELSRRANRLAHELIARGVGPEVPVAVCIPRGVEAIVAILGILKAGGAYVPVAPDYPEARQRFIIEDARVAMILVDGGSTAADISSSRAPVLVIDDESVSRRSDSEPTHSSDPEDPNRLLYILYTSGSTGAPKGVCGVHGSTIHRFLWMWREYPFQCGEVQAHRTTLTFVDSVWEIFGPLLAGVPLAVISAEEGRQPERLLLACRNAGATRITVVPSLLRAILAVCPELSRRVPTTRLWISSGERLPLSLYEQFRTAAPDALLLNLYGSTEVAGDVTCAALAADAALAREVPIGRPIANARIRILNSDMEPVPPGEVGGLYVGGPVLARGYHRRPDEERARFLPDPMREGERLFWTGDLVRQDHAGDLYHVGRADNQIKLRGMRIEPEEIEHVLSTYRPPVSATAVVLSRRDEAEEGRLIAFVAPGSLDVEELRRHAAAVLPSHMVPARIVAVDEFPLTSNGKIDRRLLSRASAWRTRAVPRHLLPQTPTERIIADIWARRLEIWPVGRDDDFFALGGDSLSAVAVLRELRQHFGLDSSVSDFAELSTIAGAARWVSERQRGGSTGPGPASRNLKIQPLQAQQLGETARLAAEVFLEREPLAVCTGLSLAEFLPFCRSVVEACVDSGLSFIAIRRESASSSREAGDRVVGFCLAHDFAVPLDAPCPARLVPVMKLLDELGKAYEQHLGTSFGPGQIVELFMSGAAREVDGFTTVLSLERASLAAAKARGFARAMTICTSKVTAHIAIEEAGFRRVGASSYSTFCVDGVPVFAPAAVVHHEAVLVERLLPAARCSSLMPEAEMPILMSPCED